MSLRATIIIPAYKAAATLEAAVSSVLAQTETDWELMIVNDKSPDDTGACADRQAARDPRIRCIHLPENRGKPYALNHATAKARGKWVALLDSDDWYAPERLKKLIDAAEAAGLPMAADNQFLYDGVAGQIAGTAFPAVAERETLDLAKFLAASDPAASFDYGMLKPVFRADFIREHTLDYYEPARIGEDYLILLRFFAAGGRAILLHEPLYYYRQPFGTISRQWAQPGRHQYNFTLLEKINQAGLDQTGAALTPTQRETLVRRGKGIAALARLDRARQAAARRDSASLLRETLTAPPAFWQLLARRLRNKISSREKA